MYRTKREMEPPDQVGWFEILFYLALFAVVGVILFRGCM